MNEQPYPWYIEWFRSPDRFWGAAEGPAVLNVIATIAVTAVANSWNYAIAAVVIHLLLCQQTARIRQRYGVREPTVHELKRMAARGDIAASRELDRRGE